ncbi:HIT domain-containing protein [Streptomyces californicus]|uniref:HIT family protein n=1 Tax=Streptomyces californicus TaxID=67351 RepID=UPI00331CAAD2
MTTACVFCRIVAGQAPADVIREWEDVIAIRPLHPVTPGHVLVIPHTHVPDVGERPLVSARAMACAAELAADLAAVNVITSKGSAATQTVAHLHLHIVPRTAGDALSLPWTSQQHTAG